MPVSAFYLRDQDQEKKGPYEISQVVGMWKQGSITAHAQYFDDAIQEWRPVSGLVAAKQHPVKHFFQGIREEMNKPEAKARQKKIRRIYWICLVVLVPLLVWIVLKNSKEMSDREWRDTVREVDDYRAQKDKEKEELWKERNRDAARRYLRNHPDGRP